MPLARFHLYAQGVDVWVAPTLAPGDAWVATMRHLAREGRMFVIGVNPCMHADQIPPSIPRPDALYPAADRDREDGWLLPGNTIIVDPTATSPRGSGGTGGAHRRSRARSGPRASRTTFLRSGRALQPPGCLPPRGRHASPPCRRGAGGPVCQATSAGNLRIPSVAVEPPPRPSERSRPSRKSVEKEPLSGDASPRQRSRAWVASLNTDLGHLRN